MWILVCQRAASRFGHPLLVFLNVGGLKANRAASANAMMVQFATSYKSIDCLGADVQAGCRAGNRKRLIGWSYLRPTSA